MRSASPREIRSRSPSRRPSTRVAAAPTLATASAIGTSAGIASRASSVGTSSGGITSDALEALGRVEAGRRRPAVACPAGDEAAVDRGGDVVRVPLDLGGAREQVLGRQRQLVEVVRGGEAGDDRRGARAEAAGERDLAADREPEPVRGVQRLEGAHDQVVAAQRQVEPVGDDLELAGLLDLELELEADGGREHVVAGAEVGRGGGDADEAAAAGHLSPSTSLRSRPARSRGARPGGPRAPRRAPRAARPRPRRDRRSRGRGRRGSGGCLPHRRRRGRA